MLNTYSTPYLNEDDLKLNTPLKSPLPGEFRHIQSDLDSVVLL